MHDLPDPEHEAAEFGEEILQPDRFKLLLRDRIKQNITQAFGGREDIARLYQSYYRDSYPSLNDFVCKLGNLVVIGAENGADEALDRVQKALRARAPLCSAGKVTPGLALDGAALVELGGVIAREFGEHHFYEHIYEHSGGAYSCFASFVGCITGVLVAGAAEGAEEMLKRVRAAVERGVPLPRASRYSRRLCVL